MQKARLGLGNTSVSSRSICKLRAKTVYDFVDIQVDLGRSCRYMICNNPVFIVCSCCALRTMTAHLSSMGKVRATASALQQLISTFGLKYHHGHAHLTE